MSAATADPGQDPRGAPDPAPLWTVLDMTPEGRAGVQSWTVTPDLGADPPQSRPSCFRASWTAGRALIRSKKADKEAGISTAFFLAHISMTKR